MDLLFVVRSLVRMRLLVFLGLLCAAAVGLVVAFEVSLLPPKLGSRETSTGVAVARLQLDTAPSIIARGALPEFQVLEAQASLLADFMASNEAEVDIARRAGLPVQRLLVVGPSMLQPLIPSPLAVDASQAAAVTPEPYVLTVETTESTAILRLEATAPTAVAARQLAVAGIAGVASAVTRLGTPGATRLVVKPLGAVGVATKSATSKVPVGAVVGVVLFGMWCAGLIILAGLMRRARGSSVRTAIAID